MDSDGFIKSNREVDKMKFSEFAQMLKRYNSKTNAEFMTELIENISTDEINLPEENTLSKILKGNSSFSGLARKLIGKTNRELFIGYLDDFYSSYKNELINDFDLNNATDSWMEKIADIFISIINNENQIGIKKMSTSKELTEIKDLVLDSTEPSIEEANDMIKSTMNKAINAVEKIQSAKLPDELQPYYEVKYSHTNDGTFEHIVAKNKEAYEKYPFNMKVTFDVSGMTEEEKNRMLDFNLLSGEANVSNKAVLVGKMLEVKDSFGTIPSPFQNNKKGSALYILPKPSDELPVRKFTLIMKNDFMQLCFNNVNMHLLKFAENESVVSNSRFDDTYSITLKLTKKGNHSGFHYTYLVKDKYKDDAREQLQLYKWHMLGQDKKTKIIVKMEGIENPLIDSYCNGKVVYNKKDIKSINDTMDYFNKIIFIENQLGYKFKVTNENYYRNMNAIDIVYNYLRKKQKTYNCEMSFDLIVDDPIDEGLSLSGEELELGKVTMFDENIEICDTIVKMKDAHISNVEKIDNKYKVTILSNKSIIVSK